ncbi:MAG: hypothetical protein Q9160_004970 [Pyrenula sp. 1 TL-2023]
MNASSHLQSLGWLGPGHALNAHLFPPSSSANSIPQHRGRGGLGLQKPILVSQKKDTSGLGRRGRKDEPNGGEWWLKGFESALGRMGTGVSEKENGKQKEGLYGGFFVKGESLGGTLDEGVKMRVKGHQKRKSDAVEDDLTRELSDSPPPHKSLRIENGSALQGPMKDFIQASTFFKARDQDKEEKRRRKKERQDRKDSNETLDEFQQIETYLGSRDVEEAERKRRKRAAMRGRESIVNLRQTADDEDGAEQCERRGRRRKEKSNENIQSHAEVEGGEGKREVEKRRRKEESRVRRGVKASQKARDIDSAERVEAASDLGKKKAKRKNKT